MDVRVDARLSKRERRAGASPDISHHIRARPAPGAAHRQLAQLPAGRHDGRGSVSPAARSHHTPITLELEADRRVRIGAEIAAIRPYHVAEGFLIRMRNAAARRGSRSAL